MNERKSCEIEFRSAGKKGEHITQHRQESKEDEVPHSRVLFFCTFTVLFSLPQEFKQRELPNQSTG